MDKGYHGLQDILRAVHVIKQRPHGPVWTREEHQYNRDIEIARVKVENYFGRLHQLWNINKDCYCWLEVGYDTYMAICVSITNYHVTSHLLGNIDADSYRLWFKLFPQESIARREKKLGKRRRYAQKFKLCRIYTPERARREHNDEAEDPNDTVAHLMQSRYIKSNVGIPPIHCNIRSDTESSRGPGDRSRDTMDVYSSPSGLTNDQDDAIYHHRAGGNGSSQAGRRLVHGNDGEYHDDNRRRSVDDASEGDSRRRIDRADEDNIRSSLVDDDNKGGGRLRADHADEYDGRRRRVDRYGRDVGGCRDE